MPENEKENQPGAAPVEEDTKEETTESGIDKDTESVMDEIDEGKGCDKKQTKQLKEENRHLKEQKNALQKDLLALKVQLLTFLHLMKIQLRQVTISKI